MPIETIRQLSTWLAATDVDCLELRGPGVLLRLGRDLRDVSTTSAFASGFAVASAPTPAAVHAGAAGITVTAPSVGVFLHAHPLHSAPLAPPGAEVQAGAAIGLLRIGSLLLPVRAPQTGTVTAIHVTNGTSVGYGAALVALDPS